MWMITLIPDIDFGFIERLINQINDVGRDPRGGYTRLALSREDLEARKIIIETLRDLGLKIEIDKVANIVARYCPEKIDCSKPSIAIGSHIDTVVNGGPLDGVYGVASGIEAVRTIIRNNIDISKPVDIIVFTNEEGVRFPIGELGSKAMAGQIDLSEVYGLKDSEGVTFYEALRRAGLDPRNLRDPVRTKGDIEFYVELHIEQGPVLESVGKEIGIVTGIVGVYWGDLVFRSKPMHAGTTPMNLRRDPLMAAAEAMIKIRDHVISSNREAVITFGKIDTVPNVRNVIPGEVTVSIDLRDLNEQFLKKTLEDIESISKGVASRYMISVEHIYRSYSSPVMMSSKVIDAIGQACKQLGVTPHLMPSRAGHDARSMAKITDAGMIFVPSIGGVSHSPEENTKPEHLRLGAQVLLNTVLILASETK